MNDLWRQYADAAGVDLAAALTKSGHEAMTHLVDAEVNLSKALNQLEEDNICKALNEPVDPHD